MPYTFQYDQKNHFIRLVVTGLLDLDLVNEMAAAVSAEVETRGCTRILNDLRQAKPARGAIDIYEMPEMARHQGIKRDFRRALVVGEKETDFYFIETVFVNQGHQVRMFETEEQAIQWLVS